MKQMLALLLFALNAVSCNQTPTGAMPAFDLEAVKNHIHAANKIYGNRAQGDPAFFDQAYTREAWVMPAGVPKITGMGNIIAYFKAPADASPYSVNVQAQEIFGNADNVVETGQYALLDSAGVQFETGKFVVVWRQEDGRWKIHREIWTANEAASN